MGDDIDVAHMQNANRGLAASGEQMRRSRLVQFEASRLIRRISSAPSSAHTVAPA